jgi:SAM-dependent methyltransferase
VSAAGYDLIGRGYAEFRRSDPRIAARIKGALADAVTVVNVGAGAGSYEPADREVTAVEPSELMIAQRPPGSAPVVEGVAERLPFAENSFDAAMAIITIHHWSDLQAGLAEMVRVARKRVVILTFDPSPLAALWFADYFAAAIDYHAEVMPPIEALLSSLPGATVEPIAVPRECEDRFWMALWDRPELHLDPAVRRVSSGWHALSPGEVDRAVATLREDLESGVWDERHADLRVLPELDVGLRLVAADVA